MNRLFLVLVVGILDASSALAGHAHLEAWYADALAEQLPGSRTEVRMRNGTRCDVLSARHAIEVDFAEKWAQGLGQALNYSVQTGKIPAVAMILEKPADERFLAILRSVIAVKQREIAVIVLRPFGDASLTIEFPEGMNGGRGEGETRRRGAMQDTKRDEGRISLRMAIDLSAPVSAMDWLPKWQQRRTLNSQRRTSNFFKNIKNPKL